MSTMSTPRFASVPIGNISHHALSLGSSVPVAEIADQELGRIITKRFFAANPLRIYFARPQLPREQCPLYTRSGVAVFKRDATAGPYGFDFAYLDKTNPTTFAADCGEEIARALFDLAMERDGFEAIVLCPDVKPARRRLGGWK